MTAELRLCFRPDVRRQQVGHQLHLVGPESAVALEADSASWLHRFEGEGSSIEELADLLSSAAVTELDRAGLLTRTIHTELGPFASLEPLAPTETDTPTPGVYQLSRFASLRREGGFLVLETPLAPSRMILHDPRATALLGLLGQPRAPFELCQDGASQNFCQLLARGGFLSDRDAEVPESWEFHDLLFHARSRRGRHDHFCGSSDRGLSEPPLPVLKEPMSSALFDLPRPDLEALARTDPSLVAAMETRSSRRSHGSVPLSLSRLGEFLFRTARVKVLATNPGGPVTLRPYPSAGCSFELELYLAIARCAELAPGLYHYRPYEHQLCLLPDRAAERTALLRAARSGAGMRTEPHCLMVLASRMGRLAQRYESIAYALTLKNVGVLLQSMCLTACAMQLAACPVGTGNSDLFARASGLDYYRESAVGELLLGETEPHDAEG